MLTRRIKPESGAPVYHCIGRIVGGEMRLGDEEKEVFRRLMWRIAEFSGVEIITYCIMTNHVHLLVRVPTEVNLTDEEICGRLIRYYGRRETWVQTVVDGCKRSGGLNSVLRERLLARMGDVSMFMRTLKQRFSKWYNRRHERFGTLWAERFKSVLVEDDSEALGTIAMYIDLNPVRAGIVDDPKDYRFCGHAEAMGGNKSARAGLRGIVSSSNWRQASGEYRCRMMVYASGSNDRRKRALPREKVLRVLKAGGEVSAAELLRLRLRHLTDGLVFGSREFVDQVVEEFRDRFGSARKTGARKLRGLGGNLGQLSAARDLQKDTVR